MTEPSLTWITERAHLTSLVDALSKAPWIALDTEANSMFVYQERTCLIQINAGGQLFLIDPIAIDPDRPVAETMAPLKPFLENPLIPVYLHGGEYDVGILKRDYNITLTGVWDSQQAASLLGQPKTGYGAMVELLCGVKLAKDYTQYDWGTRPLDPLAIQYAIDDVVYLPKICEQLREQVRAADLEDEIGIANRAVEDTAWSGGFDPSGMWRIKGIREIANKDLGLLFALYTWRDRIAKTANKPPGRILNNEVLLALTRNAPTNYQLLKRMGLKGWFLSAYGEALIEEIRHAQSNPLTVPPRPNNRVVGADEDDRERRLKDWRRTEAERRTLEDKRTVPLQLVLPARSLDYLKRQDTCDLTTVPQLGAKRISLYGEKLLQLCRS